MSRVVKLAVIPGDGIGPEVVAEAEKVLDAVTEGAGVAFEKTRFSLGAARYLETGDTLTDEDLAAVASHDAILLGAVGGMPGDPRLKDANIERGLLLKLRFALDHYVNLRPTVLWPGVTSPLAEPGEVDFVVVREGTEGPYVGNGGAIRVGTPAEVANEVSVNTAFGVERVVRYALAKAAERRGRLTLVHKTNVLTFAGSLWQRIVREVGEWLGLGVANLAAALDPGTVVVGGGVSEAGELLLGPAREAFSRNLTGRGYRPQARLVGAELGPLAGLVGMADLARHAARP